MGYRIHFVDDTVLPEGHDFLFIQVPHGAVIFYRESTITPEVLEDSWAAYRAVGGPQRTTPAREIPPARLLRLLASA